MDFAQSVLRETNKKFTENGAAAFSSTGASSILDLYAVVGSMRSRISEVTPKFKEACQEDLLLATRLMFHARDVRGGMGEREIFRTMLINLANTNPEVVIHNMALIPFYGRWDDLFVLIGTPVESEMIKVIADQLNEDISNYNSDKPISLLAKWMPSINTSSKKTCTMAKFFAKKFEASPREYRITLSTLRNYLNVLETKMSKKDWDSILYNQVPSRAMNIYRKAFYRNDETRFSQFIEDVKAGKTEIKASALFPYDIVEKIMYGASDRTLEAQWRALPNYVEEGDNVIIMADVSGSMYGRPMATSVGLALYFAERNKGAYHNLFMTFSDNPKFHKVTGNNLALNIRQAIDGWCGGTNMEGAFNEILKVAIENHVAPEDMPKAIVIISDMEINSCVSRNWSFYDTMKARFEQLGYVIPNIVFWNVSARQDTFLVDGNRKGVQLVSGQSASTFKGLLKSFNKTSYEAMLDVLNGERYSPITL